VTAIELILAMVLLLVILVDHAYVASPGASCGGVGPFNEENPECAVSGSSEVSHPADTDRREG
jgi:hypothetical protein